jgi:hypothetical protein
VYSHHEHARFELKAQHIGAKKILVDNGLMAACRQRVAADG